MTNVFQVNVFQPSVFQEQQSPPIGGFMARYPFYYGGAAPPVASTVITTIQYSEHPVNAIMVEDQLGDKLKKVPTDWFGPKGPTVETTSGIKRGVYTPRIPDKWKR